MRARLSNGGVDIVFEGVAGALVIRYWGAQLDSDIDSIPLERLFARSIPNSDFDAIQVPGLMREHSRGWLGAPTLSGHRSGRDWSSHFELRTLDVSGSACTALLIDDALSLELKVRFELDSFGVLRSSMSLLNKGDDYILDELNYWLPLPETATQSMDFAGRWSKERNPQRRDIATGRWVRESHEGRSGHNFTIGQIALTRETNFGSGQAWSVALAWSGDSSYFVEKTYEGAVSIGAGEKFLPGEMILKSGESYQAPDFIATYSSRGLDGIAHGYHRYLRSRAVHPKSARPVTLNMWEAIYFNHDEGKIKALVDTAAELGVERVVLDDGWFGARRNDRRGLGDWTVSPDVWPHGLRAIADHIRSKGMQFGLWFEGEMVNPDSDIYRKHPEWILRSNDRTPPLWRHQLVLNLANKDAYTYVLESVSAVIAESSVSYIKWDHNRVLVDAGADGRAGVHNQTRAIYRLFKELKERHPGLEIESCASGGGRIDFGIVDYVDRFWVSDNNDALERQTIQRWTMQFMPPELLGTHVGPTPGHQTGRALSLSFRAATALFGHAGIEWDISTISAVDRDALRSWIAYYKSKRELLHSGTMIRVDYPEESSYLYGTVSADKSAAIFALAQLSPGISSQPPRLRFSGLDEKRKYRVTTPAPAGAPSMMLIKAPEWIEGESIVSGDLLMKMGLPAPILQPAQSLLIELNAI